MRLRFGLYGAVFLIGVAAAIALHHGSRRETVLSFDASVKLDLLHADWSAELMRRLPGADPARVMICDAERSKVYVGTLRTASVYGFDPRAQREALTVVGADLQESVSFGQASVSSLGLADLNGDGGRELIAITSQEVPRGQPRVYVWDGANQMRLLAMTNLGIKSSWSHGFGVVGARDKTMLSAFCGNGEVVAARLESESRDGWTRQSVAWSQVTKLPVSGEQLEVCDLDRIGPPELVVALGYADKQSAIRVYEAVFRRGDKVADDAFAISPRYQWRVKYEITENDRFANVRFCTGRLVSGKVSLIAWWCSSLNGGQSEVIRYDIDRGGIARREVLAYGDAAELWPLDGQIAMGDLNGDRRHEIYWATTSGRLWYHSGAASDQPELLARHADGFGPVAIHEKSLLVGQGARILQLRGPKRRPTPRADMRDVARA